ncbi:LytTR family DNA-binding domain-containing protein [Carboxylicivirga sp. N1Y90]|uniref:LytTR family DNA-binding domain-containing protein n=1 Tax=Carboxylicivirga fragile TaxID=3417571 RepID=UPI003D32E282|nr:LytTR family transcriptional regulator [Marinilabiliaceae bacterium N1Y90]
MATTTKVDQYIYLTKKNFRTYLGIAISIFLFILFFQPFTVDKFEFENNMLFIAGFGMIILLVLIVSQILFHQILVKAEKENLSNSIWVPLYFLFQIVASSLAFVFYIRYVGQNSMTFNTVVKVVIICFSLPVTLFLRYRLSVDQLRIRELLLETRSMQDKLKQFSESYINKHIEIISENESDNFRIQVSEIVYLKSADNYVEVGYHEQGLVKKKMLRSTLRNIEHQLVEFNNFIRTHRTSLVNIQYIDKLNKNFNSYWLSLDKTKETIPVSRQYLMAVKELL